MPDVTVTHGPFVGDAQGDHSRVWARVQDASEEPALRISAAHELSGAEGVSVVRERVSGDPTIVKWRVSGLEAGEQYRYEIVDEAGGLVRGNAAGFLTPDAGAATACLAIGSCADEDEGTEAILREIVQWKPTAVLLLGDTPYIDSVDRATQWRRHGEFLAMPALQECARDRPLYAVWDDHDFGLNDTDGRMPGKDVAREAFLGWHANPSAGDGQQGIYFSFRTGPIEVFVLDTRWFSRTARNPRAQHEWTLLGDAQWKWLESGLAASTARWKVIASSMVFNSAVRPFKSDYWGAYPTEYKRLVSTLAALHVRGAVLVSGDVHQSRLLRHPTRAALGYDLMEVVSSPMHERVHDSLLWARSDWVEASFPQPNMMALLTAEEQRGGGVADLRVRFVDATGRVYFDRVLLTEEGGAAALMPTSTDAEIAPPWDAVAAELAQRQGERAATARALNDSAQWLGTPGGVRTCASAGWAAAEQEQSVNSLLTWVASPPADPPPESRGCTPRARPVNSSGIVHLTGYATPEVSGRLLVDGPTWPLVARPADIARGEPGPARERGMVVGAPLLCGVDDPLDGYLAEVNGSVRVRLPDGSALCLANDGTNELPYRSLGRMMIEAGMLAPDAASLLGVRRVYGEQPREVRELMMQNPRHVYWKTVPCESFPPSASGPTLIPFHSVAVDPRYIAPGTPALLRVVIAGEQRNLIAVCTDIGGAIVGPARVDLYCGIGPDAMRVAGEINGEARMWVLELPSAPE